MLYMLPRYHILYHMSYLRYHIPIYDIIYYIVYDIRYYVVYDKNFQKLFLVPPPYDNFHL